jgi:hypothetical protein
VKLPRARAKLFIVFLTGFVAQAALTILVYLRQAISSTDVINLLTQSLTVYSVPMAVMLGGIFGSPTPTSKETAKNRTAFTVAFVLAIVWNGLLVWRFIMFAYAGFNAAVDDGADKVAAYIEQIAKVSSFLVAGALAYFFSRTP